MPILIPCAGLENPKEGKTRPSVLMKVRLSFYLSTLQLCFAAKAIIAVIFVQALLDSGKE